MGCSIPDAPETSRIKNQFLIVATLNYGGILTSPFQFFSDDKVNQSEMSLVFKSLISQYFKDFDQKTFKWNVGKIDQRMQRQRYSPIYRSECGVQNGKLIGMQEFKRKWDKNFGQAIKTIKINPQPTSEQIQNIKIFDLICYHAFLTHIYKIKNLGQIQSGSYDPSKYLEFSRSYFSRSYLNEDKKIKTIQKALHQSAADVFFFQQPTVKLIEALKKQQKYYIKQKGPDVSLAFIKKSSFQQIDYKDQYMKSKLNSAQIQNMNWNNDTNFIVTNKYIFVSGHLSSKKQRNILQVQQMKKSLQTLTQKCVDKHLIIGGDMNTCISLSGLQNFNCFPSTPQQSTTRKKRTFIQPQYNKSQIMNEQCKDQIFSTLQIAKKGITTIQSKEVLGEYLLPTDQHPFDHFMIVCYLRKDTKRREARG